MLNHDLQNKNLHNYDVPTIRLNPINLMNVRPLTTSGILFLTIAEITQISLNNVAAFTQEEMRLSEFTINVPTL